MPQPTVADVMTADVVIVTPEASYKEVVEVLAAKQVNAVPVVAPSGRPVGVVSETDLVAKSEVDATTPHRWWALVPSKRALLAKARARTARELMSSPPVTIRETATVSAAARTMAQRKVRRLLVIDEDDVLIGIISHRDVLSTFLRGDEDIQTEIVQRVFEGAMFFPHGAAKAQVVDGVVTLTGTAERRGEVDITEEIVKAVTGVVAVHNELGYRLDDVAAAK
jgi:CBS domain-containing protein